MTKKTNKPKTENSLRISTEKEDLYYHTEADRIAIRTSDLIRYFQDFKEAIKKRPNLTTLIALISIWVPLFTSDFRSLLGLTPEYVSGGYFVFVIIVTLLILLQWLTGILRPLVKLSKTLLIKIWPDVEIWLEKTETDPDKKIAEIRSKCERNK